MAALRIKCMQQAQAVIPAKGLRELMHAHCQLCLAADILLDYALGNTEKTEDGLYSIKSKVPLIKQSFG